MRRCIPGYFEPLPAVTQKAALEKGGQVGVSAPGEVLFWPAFANARATAPVMARLSDFMNLYGFCRNTALVAFIDAGIFYWSFLQPKGPADHLLWARIALVVGIGMTLRYLKFYRHYAVELFSTTPWKATSHAMLPLHEHCLFKNGIHLGELWYFTPLATWLREHKRNRFLLTAPPLRLPGAVGSPATPIATV